MKCFLIAQESWTNTDVVFNDVCPSLLNIASLPFIEWQIGNIVEKGVNEIRISGGHFTSLIEKRVGDGSKWNIKISYIVCQEGKPWVDIFKLNNSFFECSDDCFLLIRGNILFQENENFTSGNSILFNMELEEFDSCPINTPSAAFLTEKAFKNISKVGFTDNYITKDNPMAFDTPAAFFDLNSMLLQSDGKFGGITLPVTKEGVYIHETSKIHCEAELSPPSLIGANSKIEKGVVISSFSSIGDNCIIDSDAVIRNSIIDSNTYIGKNSVIDSSIISNRRMFSKINDTSTFIPSKFWVDSIKQDELMSIEKVSFIERFCALIIWIFYLPKLMFAGCRRKKYVTIISSVKHQDDRGNLQTEEIEYMMDKSLKPHLAVLSALPEVIKGKMHLCGRIALSPEQFNTVPPDFIDIFFPSKPGIITISENMVCKNCFNRRLQDLYLCGNAGFLKRFSFFLESFKNLKHINMCDEFVNEYGFGNKK